MKMKNKITLFVVLLASAIGVQANPVTLKEIVSAGLGVTGILAVPVVQVVVHEKQANRFKRTLVNHEEAQQRFAECDNERTWAKVWVPGYCVCSVLALAESYLFWNLNQDVVHTGISAGVGIGSLALGYYTAYEHDKIIKQAMNDANSEIVRPIRVVQQV